MTASFAQELADRGVDSDSVHHALRYWLAERCADLTPEDMRAQLYRVAGQDRVDRAQDLLSHNAELLEDAALFVLSAAWSDETERDRLRAVLAEAKGKLPVVEIASIVIGCMYGLHLCVTRGLRRSEKTVVRKPDGSFEIREAKEYINPVRALGAVVDLLRPPGARPLDPPHSDKNE